VSIGRIGRIGQHLLHWLWSFLQWLGGKAWQFLVLTFWLLIQTLELLLWAIAELKCQLRSVTLTVKKALKQKDFQIFLWPLQGLLKIVLEIIVQGFWLLIQTLEMIIWYGQLWQKKPQQQSSPRKRKKGRSGKHD
jgi:hypothetical protein